MEQDCDSTCEAIATAYCTPDKGDSQYQCRLNRRHCLRRRRTQFEARHPNAKAATQAVLRHADIVRYLAVDHWRRVGRLDRQGFVGRVGEVSPFRPPWI